MPPMVPWIQVSSYNAYHASTVYKSTCTSIASRQYYNQADSTIYSGRQQTCHRQQYYITESNLTDQHAAKCYTTS